MGLDFRSFTAFNDAHITNSSIGGEEAVKSTKEQNFKDKDKIKDSSPCVAIAIRANVSIMYFMVQIVI